MTKEPFHGEGFSQSPIDGEEAARHRHLFNKLSEKWPVLNDTSSVVAAFVVLSKMIKIGGPVVIGAAIVGAWSKTQGWF